MGRKPLEICEELRQAVMSDEFKALSDAAAAAKLGVGISRYRTIRKKLGLVKPRGRLATASQS